MVGFPSETKLMNEPHNGSKTFFMSIKSIPMGQWENLGEDKANGAIVQCFEDHKRP